MSYSVFHNTVVQIIEKRNRLFYKAVLKSRLVVIFLKAIVSNNDECVIKLIFGNCITFTFLTSKII